MKRIYSQGLRKQILSQLSTTEQGPDFPMYGHMGDELDKFYDSIGESNWQLLNSSETGEDADEEYTDEFSHVSGHYTRGTGVFYVNNTLDLTFQLQVYYPENLQRIYGPIGEAVNKILTSTPEWVEENPSVEAAIASRYPSPETYYEWDTSYMPNVVDATPVGDGRWNVILNVQVEVEYRRRREDESPY